MSLLRLTPAVQARKEFLADVRSIAGDGVRLLWTPFAGDRLVVADEAVNLITWDANPATRVSALGRGFKQSFNGSQYGVIPDADKFSFGNGTADSPFSVVAVANITDTAAARALLSKDNTSNREWVLYVESTDAFKLQLSDASAGVNPVRVSGALTSQGSPAVYGASYDGSGGATAINGITEYLNGAVLTSTASNSATYVAMENKAADVNIGASFNHGSNRYSGSMALLLLVAANLSAAQHLALYNRCKLFFGL